MYNLRIGICDFSVREPRRPRNRIVMTARDLGNERAGHARRNVNLKCRVPCSAAVPARDGLTAPGWGHALGGRGGSWSESAIAPAILVLGGGRSRTAGCERSVLAPAPSRTSAARSLGPQPRLAPTGGLGTSPARILLSRAILSAHP